ncbi:MAG: GAF domain-containing protein [Leptolyngbyaceae cyanobacterium SM1_3_5]|nr:GAF domain-containing protein [Leptolyngbyaceae cyanobacterium SM1_3_5]
MTQVPSKPTVPDSYSEFEEISDTSNWLESSPAQAVRVGSRHSQAPHQRLLRWWQSISIRRKATVLAIMLGTVPLTAFGIEEYVRSSKRITQSVSQAQIEAATVLSDQVITFMLDRYGDLEVVANLSIFTDAQLRDSASLQQKAAELNTFIEAYGVYDSIALFDLNGNVLVSAGADVGTNAQGQRTRNIAEYDHFQAVLESDRPLISQPSVSPATGKASIYLASPVKDTATEETIAIVRLRVPVEVFSQLLQQKSNIGAEAAPGEEAEEESSEFHLVGADGKSFIAADAEEVGQAATEEVENFADLQAAGEATAAITTDQRENTRHLVTYAPIENSELPDLNWSILLTEDAAVAFADQRSLILALVLGLGLTALIVSALATYLANRATDPIVDAAEVVNRIGQGDLDARLEVGGRDEVSTLGTNINNMAAQIQGLIAAQTFEAAQERLLTAAKGSGVLGRAELQEILNQTVEGARTLLNLDRVVVYHFEGDFGRGIIAESVMAGWPSALEDGVNDSCIPADLREAYRQGRVVATRNVAEANWHPDHMQLMERLQIKANLVVPIVTIDRLYGLLIAHSCVEAHEWQEAEINLLKRLGDELALTIYRVELLEQTTRLAEEQRQIKEGLQMRALELLQEVDPISRGDLTTRAKVTADEIGTIADSYN